MLKRISIILIIILSVTSFSFLVYYGFTHRRGEPVLVEEGKRAVLEVPLADKEIDLLKGIDREFWNTLPSKEIKLLYQVMVLPWPKVVTPSVNITAFHNNKDISFYITWKDETENRTMEINRFSDACAIMFPIGEKAQTPTLLMGFLGKANIWHWKASQDNEYWNNKIESPQAYADYYYPFEDKETLVVSKEIVKSAVNDLMAIRVGTVTPKENQNINGRGFWDKGQWHVVIKRSLKAPDPQLDAEFKTGKRLCAFAVWNGQTGDRGGRKSISDWVELEIR